MRRFSAQNIIIMCLIMTVTVVSLGIMSDSHPRTVLIILASSLGLIVLYGRSAKPESYAPDEILEQQTDISLKEQAKLADGFAEPIIIINQHQRILYANPAAKTLFPERNTGTTLPNLVYDPEVRALTTDTLEGRPTSTVKYKLDKPVERHFRVMGSMIATDGKPDSHKRALIIFYDITNIVRANIMRADFLANASHELKTPVASLLGYIETLRGHAKDDPEARETFLAIMQQQAERMQRLIADLLSLRRIELVEHIAPKETADLFLATRAAIEALEPLARSRNVDITLQSPKSVPVIGIQDELIQLVLNILDNAVKFAPEKSTISLHLDVLQDWSPGQIFAEDPAFNVAHKRRIVIPYHSGQSYAALRIRDSGPGFDREHLPRIGERFYKITNQDNPVKQGTGLGLAIVKHIVLRHRGGLFVESAKASGTKFTILLPTRAAL